MSFGVAKQVNSLTSFSRTTIFAGKLSVLENLQCWIATNAKFGTSIFTTFCAINLGQSDWWIISSYQFGCFCIFRFQSINRIMQNQELQFKGPTVSDFKRKFDWILVNFFTLSTFQSEWKLKQNRNN